jgi:hypothetical protein
LIRSNAAERRRRRSMLSSSNSSSRRPKTSTSTSAPSQPRKNHHRGAFYYPNSQRRHHRDGLHCRRRHHRHCVYLKALDKQINHKRGEAMPKLQAGAYSAIPPAFAPKPRLRPRQAGDRCTLARQDLPHPRGEYPRPGNAGGWGGSGLRNAGPAIAGPSLRPLPPHHRLRSGPSPAKNTRKGLWKKATDIRKRISLFFFQYKFIEAFTYII